MRTVHLSILLKPACRDRATLARVGDLANDLGLEVTSTGAAAVSCRLAPKRFRELFGVDPENVTARPACEGDFGTAAGHAVPAYLRVPSVLSPFVESVTITPPATRFGP